MDLDGKKNIIYDSGEFGVNPNMDLSLVYLNVIAYGAGWASAEVWTLMGLVI